ncbi:6-bladed beta-propeller [Dethiobacter alkaliphilus]|uniref:NHL repeat containing protein n=1 Tax=Dethiobacter alkaliphilus AHT 1 TaxID=555088 RepID=C0GG35_DETAL|nr:6-bladed beta-propeller [Dethiobacter alkaliphilus]EEG77724.1 NHL repeat containing protein [Dethiobacter alkaliphilus AHT 1]
MNQILSIPLRQVNYSKFIKLMLAVTIVITGTFGALFVLSPSAPGSTSVAPGRLGAPVFSHYIYGDFGDNALHKPMFATFGNGRVYVSDTNNWRVQVFEEDGTPITKFGERGGDPGQFYYPYGIVIGPDSNVYVADMYSDIIQVFTPDGEYIGRFADEYSKTDYLSGPAGMHLDDRGRLFVANVNTGKVSIFDINSEELLNTVTVSGDVFAPNDVTVDSDGFIYVVDTGGQRVVVYSPDTSRPVRIINGSSDGRGAATLSNPRGIGIRGDWIMVVSNLSHTIHAFHKDGTEDFAFGSQGDAQNQFMHPNGLFIDGRGRMLITDTIGARVAVYR